MIIIKIFANFKWSKPFDDTIIELCDLNNDPDFNTKYMFTKKNDYTHALVFNKTYEKIKVAKENVIGLSFEPLVFLNLKGNDYKIIKDTIGKYYIGWYKSSMPINMVEGFRFIDYWKEPWSCKTQLKPKTKFMSIIFSKKKITLGHQYRHILVDAILKTNLPIDIYGGGCNLEKYKNNDDPRIKGEFETHSYLPYEDYMFHICIENVNIPHYLSEKIINPLLVKTIPLYWGCKNIDDYFPNTYYGLTGNADKDIDIITDIHNNTSKYSNIAHNIDVANIKNKININNVIKEFYN
jgi:hypothetical protein